MLKNIYILYGFITVFSAREVEKTCRLELNQLDNDQEYIYFIELSAVTLQENKSKVLPNL